jgi:hypothetical protein
VMTPPVEKEWQPQIDVDSSLPRSYREATAKPWA